MSSGRLVNLVNSVDILVEHAQGIDYRRVLAMHWVPGGLARGDWIRWNPATGIAEIRHYLVMREEPHPERHKAGVRRCWLAAPVPDVVVGGQVFWARDTLPPQPDIVEALRFRRLDPHAFD